MEVAGSGKRLVGSIRTSKPRQILYIQMIMIRIPNHIIKIISRLYYLIVSNKASYFFICSTNIYCQQQALMRISNQNIPPPKKTNESTGPKQENPPTFNLHPLRRCAADVLFAHRNAHCNVPDSTLQTEGGMERVTIRRPPG